MSDPLSVTASIASLIQLAASLGSTVYRFHQGTVSAPDSAKHLRDELTAIKAVLYEVGVFVNDQRQSEHGVHVSIRNFLVVISDCVLTFSALDNLINELVGKNSSLPHQVRWAIKERDIVTWTERLARHQSILNTMLGISQLHVTRDIQADIGKLVGEINALRTNIMDMQLAARIEDRLTNSYDYVTGCLLPTEQRGSGDSDALSATSSRASHSYSAALRRSMVYRRVRWRSSRQTVSESDRSDSRSIASNMTVGEASNLSTYALPLYPNEVSNTLSPSSSSAISFCRAPGSIPVNPPTSCSPPTSSNPTPIPFSPEEVQPSQIFELPAEPVRQTLPPVAGDPAFLRAVMLSATTSGDDDLVRRLVPFVLSLDSQDRAAFTTKLLQIAIYHLWAHIARTLLADANADVNNPDEDGRMAIHSAVRSGNLPLVEMILWEYPRGCLVARNDSLGRNAVHEAVMSRFTDSEKILRMLLSHSPAAVNRVDSAGDSPLHLAVAYGETTLARIMVREFSADINIRNVAGQLPLQVGLESENRHAVRDIIRDFVSFHTKEDLATVVAESIRKGWGIAILGSAGANFGTIDPQTGRPALHTAIHYGKLRSAKVLIDNFCENPYSLTADGYTVLHVAVTCETPGDTDGLIRWLVEDRKVPVDWSGHQLTTPLLHAMKCERFQAARVLLELGANVFARDRDGKSARDIALLKGQTSLAKALLAREAPASSRNDEDMAIPDDAEPEITRRVWTERSTLTLQGSSDRGGPHRAATIGSGSGSLRFLQRSRSPAIRAPLRNQSAPDTVYSTASFSTSSMVPIKTVPASTRSPLSPRASPTPVPPYEDSRADELLATPEKAPISHETPFITPSPASSIPTILSAEEQHPPPIPPKIPQPHIPAYRTVTEPAPTEIHNLQSISAKPCTEAEPNITSASPNDGDPGIPKFAHAFHSSPRLDDFSGSDGSSGRTTSFSSSSSPPSRTGSIAEEESDVTEPEDDDVIDLRWELREKSGKGWSLPPEPLKLELTLPGAEDWSVGIDEVLKGLGLSG